MLMMAWMALFKPVMLLKSSIGPCSLSIASVSKPTRLSAEDSCPSPQKSSKQSSWRGVSAKGWAIANNQNGMNAVGSFHAFGWTRLVDLGCRHRHVKYDHLRRKLKEHAWRCQTNAELHLKSWNHRPCCKVQLLKKIEMSVVSNYTKTEPKLKLNKKSLWLCKFAWYAKLVSTSSCVMDVQNLELSNKQYCSFLHKTSGAHAFNNLVTKSLHTNQTQLITPVHPHCLHEKMHATHSSVQQPRYMSKSSAACSNILTAACPKAMLEWHNVAWTFGKCLESFWLQWDVRSMLPENSTSPVCWRDVADVTTALSDGRRCDVTCTAMAVSTAWAVRLDLGLHCKCLLMLIWLVAPDAVAHALVAGIKNTLVLLRFGLWLFVAQGACTQLMAGKSVVLGAALMIILTFVCGSFCK